jgi:phage N-6-adenine-methyltransferase
MLGENKSRCCSVSQPISGEALTTRKQRLFYFMEKKMNIKIDPEFHALIPPLSDDEIAQLEENIRAEGCRDALVTWQGILVDGHNRFEICERLKIPYKTTAIELPGRAAAIEWIINNQVGRRNLSASQRATLAVELIPFLEKRSLAERADAVTRRHEKDRRIKELESTNPYWKPLPPAAAEEIAKLHSDERRKGKGERQQVYFISTGTGHVKIGIAAYPEDRLKTFKTNDPASAIIATVPGGREVEKWIHEILSSDRIGKSETFSDTPKVRAEIEAICSFAKNNKTTEFHSGAIAAKRFGVSPSYVTQAKKMKAESPERFEAVKRGEKNLRDTGAHVSNNSGENEWHTPPEYIEAARKVMGEIDCDPASIEIANRIVRAKKFYTAQDDGLKQKWGKRVWMNPPYAQPLVSDFCESVTARYESGEIEQACVLVNNATETGWFQGMLEKASAVCFIRGRVKFLDMEGKPGAPLQGQALLYFGNDIQKFSLSFSKFGSVLKK